MNKKRISKDRLETIVEGIKKLPPEKIDRVESFLKKMGKQAVGIREAAEILDVSLDTIRRAIKSGALKANRLNERGDWRIPLSEIERFTSGGK